MKDPEENYKENRKTTHLTREEWLTFFFFPFQSKKSALDTNTFNKVEEERFQKFGFEKKIKQSAEARACGLAFYILLFSIIVVIVNW